MPPNVLFLLQQSTVAFKNERTRSVEALLGKTREEREDTVLLAGNGRLLARFCLEVRFLQVAQRSVA